ncbi:membrane protein insertase YidC [Kytococcus schroeteri]|uniref:Membrane protein insertase YidC n=1 Tax=Kytococcus schroeteri TaxID=138300 RepID=A0A2I1PCW1_9MICO|nr:membrane protein insertase YidC [Kytococcus schroeteri]PKZ42440.1 membrane protein insertase YidC [Kytococcus schroeteri]
MPNLLYPIEWAVAAILAGAHRGLTALGMPSESGWTWVLSILALVVLARLAMIPLVIKQIHSSRKMQLLAPEIKKIQQKYKGKRDQASMQRQQAETMELYRANGTNPMASCLPLLLQIPIMYGLFRVLRAVPGVADGAHAPIGFMTQDLARSFDSASIFGAELSDTFLHDPGVTPKVVALVLVVLMTAFTFFSMKMSMDINMPETAKEGPMGQSQTIMLYVMPLVLAFTGVNFAIALLVYWTLSNLWSYFQQLYIIRHMPTPNTEAERRMHARQIAKGQEPTRMTLAPVGGKDSGAHALGDEKDGATDGGRSTSSGKGASGPQVNPVSAGTRMAQGGTGGQRSQPVRRKKSKKSKKQRKKG